jgi:poly(hydroxyalkanoate) depolymerase family esterase
MRNLSDTINRLSSLRAIRSGIGSRVPGPSARLSPLENFGSNPGMLGAKVHVPTKLKANAPLVVVLHGCMQTAETYAEGAGWLRLADEHGFALLFPQQQRSNNPNLCFNWFVPAHCQRDSGEPLSIRQMIAAMVANHGIDEKSIFITGLSAGGAMTSVMLATYPEVFAGGAVIAGLPYNCARTMPEAFDQMRGHIHLTERELQNRVRDASTHRGPWPTISVWHGTADHTVADSNADATVAQWRGVHDVDAAPSNVTNGRGWTRRRWNGSAGTGVIEQYQIIGMGHGTPITAGTGAGEGIPGPFVLDVGVSSTRILAASWKLGPIVHQTSVELSDDAVEGRLLELKPTSALRGEPSAPTPGGAAYQQILSIKQKIENALHAAGLMR